VDSSAPRACNSCWYLFYYKSKPETGSFKKKIFPKLCCAASNYVPRYCILHLFSKHAVPTQVICWILCIVWLHPCLLEVGDTSSPSISRSSCTHIYRVKRRTLSSWGLTNVIVHTGYWLVRQSLQVSLSQSICTFDLSVQVFPWLLFWSLGECSQPLQHCTRAQSVSHSLTHSQVAPEDRKTDCTALHCTANSKRNKAVAVRMPRQTWDVFRLQKVFGKNLVALSLLFGKIYPIMD
jgi:hypothetical protein